MKRFSYVFFASLFLIVGLASAQQYPPPQEVMTPGFPYGKGFIYEDRNSLNRSGVEVDRTFYLPEQPAYAKLDFGDSADYKRKEYPDYGQILLTKPLQAGNTLLKPGYYVLKLENVILPPTKWANFKHQTTGRLAPISRLVSKPFQKPAPPSLLPPGFQIQKPIPAMVIKQAGRRELVIPIGGREILPKALKKGDIQARLSAMPNALTNENIVRLSYCIRNSCYQSIEIRPGLLN
jgi:hypothetical protein